MIDIGVKMLWSSDWNGKDVGFPESDVVGLYKCTNENGDGLNLYVDYDTGEILDFWVIKNTEPYIDNFDLED